MSIWAVVSTAVVFICFDPLPKMTLRISHPVAHAGVYVGPPKSNEVEIPGVAPGGL